MNKPYTMKFKLETFSVHDSRTPEGKTYKAGVPLRSSEDLDRVARGLYAELDADKEHFVLVALNNKNRMTGHKLISTGSVTASLVDPKSVFTAALELQAVALLCVHNHPSGDPQPSQEDITLTRRLKECAELLNFRLLDHVVLGDDRYFSFSDKGML